MNRFKYITAVAVGISLGCAVACAHADSVADYLHLETGVGASVYSKGPDGYWYQDAFAHKLRLEAPAFEVGLTGPIWQSSKWGVDWHADWAWLGTVHTDAQAVPLDANYNTRAKTCNGPCLPLANYHGSGHEAGFILSLEPYYRTGNWRLGIEAGPFIHKTVWTEDVSNIIYNNWQPAPISLRYVSSDGWRVGAVVGASASYKNFALAYEHFFVRPTASNSGPSIWHSVDSLFLRYRF